MTEEFASRWSRLQASDAHCITVGSAPDERNSSGMRCKNLSGNESLLMFSVDMIVLNVCFSRIRNFYSQKY